MCGSKYGNWSNHLDWLQLSACDGDGDGGNNNGDRYGNGDGSFEAAAHW